MTTKRIKDLATVKYTGYLALDDEDGTGKMDVDTIFNNFAPKFVPNSTTTVAGQPYVYDGSLYVAKEAYNGPWDASKFIKKSVVDFLSVIFDSTITDVRGYLKSNESNGNVTSYEVGSHPTLLTTIPTFKNAFVKVAKGTKVLVPKQDPSSYIFAYPMLFNRFGGYLKTYDIRGLSTVTHRGKPYCWLDVDENGYLFVACATDFDLICYSMTCRGSEDYDLTEDEKIGFADYLGLSSLAENVAKAEVEKLQKVASSDSIKGYYYKTNSTNGTPQPYTQGQVPEVLTAISTVRYARIAVSEGEVLWTRQVNPSSYIYAYPILLDEYNGYIATFDTRAAETKTINGLTYVKSTMIKAGYLIVCNSGDFDIYSENPTKRNSFAPNLSETERKNALTYFGLLTEKSSNVFDYEVAKSMDRTLLKGLVETTSNGCCTVIYDDNGYPSMMRKIPLMAISSLDTRLIPADSAAPEPIFDYTPHPAFVVNGVTKKCIYAGAFMNSVYNNVPVSWPDPALPLMRSLNITQCKTKCADKGTGWHLETIWERSLISLLINKLHGPKPACNNNRGRSNKNYGLVAESYETTAGAGHSFVPGDWASGDRWKQGSQPVEWSHDLTRWGIFDFCGGYHEFVDLAKIVNGKILLADDNNFNLVEGSWTDTGAYMAWDGTKVKFSTSTDVQTTGQYESTNWSDVVCDSDYSNLQEGLRRNLALALICPRLSASDNAPLFDFNGELSLNDHITAYPIYGGAEEYGNSGLGMVRWGYDNTAVHNNMGSRLFYIE